MIMPNSTHLKHVASALALAALMFVPTQVSAQRSHLFPQTGYNYLGTDSATQSNPQAELEFDSHGNLIARSSGTFSNTEVSGYEYDYSKGYGYLLNEYTAWLTRTTADSIFSMQTKLNSNGVRTYVSKYLTTDWFDKFTFDDLGHITNFIANSDTFDITWDGEKMTSYSHVGSKRRNITQLNNVEVAFSIKPFNAMEYDYDALVRKFQTYGVFVNATGHYTYSSWSSVKFDSDITITTTTNDDKTKAEQLVMAGTDTLSIQTYTRDDENGSYTLVSREPALYPTVSTVSHITYNEYGDVIMQVDSTAYAYNGDVTYDVARSYNPVDYEDDKPLRKMHYYWSTTDKNWILGSIDVYDSWWPTTGIATVENKADESATTALLYSVSGKLIRKISTQELQGGRISGLDNGVYILWQNGNAKKLLVRK